MGKQFDCDSLREKGVVDCTCCDSCHDATRYDTGPVEVTLPDGGKAKVCCHVERALSE